MKLNETHGDLVEPQLRGRILVYQMNRSLDRVAVQYEVNRERKRLLAFSRWCSYS